MKKNILLLLAIVISMAFVHAQHDVMYFMKNDVVINQQSITPADVDSIIFYNPDESIITVTLKLNFYNDVPEEDRPVYSEGPTDIRVKDMEGTVYLTVEQGTLLGDVDEIFSLPTMAYHYSSYLREDIPYEFGGWTTDPLTVEDPINIDTLTINSNVTLYAKWNTTADGEAWSLIEGAFDASTGTMKNNLTRYYKKVAHLVIPEKVGGVNVVAVGDNCFGADRVYLTLTVPEGVTTLGNGTFDAAYSLRKVTLPSTITSLGDACFGGSWMPVTSFNLHTFIIKATVPPSFGTNAISLNYLNLADIKIIVPSASVDAYKAAPGWSAFSLNIVGQDF